MKYFIYALITIATALLIYNATHLEINNLLIGDSKTALIGVFASACVIVLMLILVLSRSIQQKNTKR